MPPPLPYTIVADDLTGACDSAAPFAELGHRTVVHLDRNSTSCDSADVAAYSTDTRSTSHKVAADTVHRLIRSLKSNGERRFVKKIDSTLLGNFAQESQAAMDTLGAAVTLIAPSFPSMGRSVIEGSLRVAGGAPGMRIADVVERELGVFCHTLPLAAVREGSAALIAAVHRGERDGCRWFAIDAASEGDLGVVADTLDVLGQRVLPVCSGGLTAILARRAGAGRGIPVDVASPQPCEARGVVVFVGSVNAHTDRQVAHLVGAFDTAICDLDNGACEHVRDAIAHGRTVVVRVTWPETDADRLGALLAECATRGIAGVVATGGDTARRVCRLAGCSHLVLEGEVATGSPRGRFGDGLLAGVALVTKAGGFGRDDALLAAARYLRGDVKPTNAETHTFRDNQD